MSNYQKHKLKEISSFEYGKMPKKAMLLKRGYPIFSGYRVVGYYPEYMYEEEKLIIIARGVGGTGKVKLSPPKSFITNLSIVFNTNKEKVNYRYLYYYLSNIDLKSRLDTGSAQSQITIDQLENFVVSLPELSHQNNVEKILNIIDSRITLNSKLNAELESMAKTIYDYWFMQFDFPDKNGKPYKSNGGKLVWSEKLNKNIPVGWEVGYVGDIFDTKLGGTPSTKNEEYWKNGSIAWLSSEEVSNSFILNSNKTITRKGLENSAATQLLKGSIVISIVRYIRTSILGIDSTTNQSVVGIPETDTYKKEYIYPYFLNETKRLMSIRTGAQQPHINKQAIDESIMLLPSEKILSAYYQTVNAIYENILIKAKETNILQQTRDWLLPMLVNGQIKIS